MNTQNKQLLKILESLGKALTFLSKRQIQVLTPFQEEVLCYSINKHWDGESEVMIEQLYEIVTSKVPAPTFTLPHQQFNSEGE